MHIRDFTIGSESPKSVCKGVQKADSQLQLAVHEETAAFVRNEFMRVKPDGADLLKALLPVYTHGSIIIRKHNQTDAFISVRKGPRLDLLNQTISDTSFSKVFCHV
jgi:hypothetical protein